MTAFIHGLPKVELHLHIEGSLEPELAFQLAQRNGIAIPFDSPDALKQAYEFDNLQSFLDIYYQGANVLHTEQDFYDLTMAYIERCKQDNVIHTEIFFDPQTHTERGIAFDTVINGIDRALQDGKQHHGISSHMIMCFLRHLSEEEAITTLKQSLPHKHKIVGVGLDSSELGHEPTKFARVFNMAIEEGYLTVAHAGEEGPAQNIIDSLDVLQVSRVDHGVRCTDDKLLLARLIENEIPLTVCPLSNVKLQVFNDMSEHNVVELLRKGLKVTINSDDPAYFGGYMTDNFLAVHNALPMSYEELAQLSINAIDGSFIGEELKQTYRDRVLSHLESYR